MRRNTTAKVIGPERWADRAVHAARTCFVGLWLLVAAGCERGAATPPPVAVGKPAPLYAAANLAGARVATPAFAGRVVLLNVWATWCAPCREEIPFLEQLHQKHVDRGLTIVGVSVDADGENDKVAAFAKEMGMTYTIWRDPDQRILSEYMAIGVPASYLIDRTGVLRWKHVGVIHPTDAAFLASLDSALAAAP